MRIISKTNGGFILEARADEVEYIMSVVEVNADISKVDVNTHIPVTDDYEIQILKRKALEASYYLDKIASMNRKIESAKNI